MTLTMTNGTTTGEPRIMGLDDGPEMMSFDDFTQLAHVVADFKEVATTPVVVDSTPAPAVVHASWCVKHDDSGEFCWSEHFEVAGVDLQLANSDGPAKIIGLDDTALGSVLTVDDAADLAAALTQLVTKASTTDPASTPCPRFTWCTLAGDPDHAGECASLTHQVRDMQNEQWSMYLRAPADTRDLVELCIDGRVRGVPLSGGIVASQALAAVSAFHHDREAMLGVFAAVETVPGYDCVVALLQAGVSGARKDVA